jgi:uncharacterized delta-60 repeat protein
MYRIGYLKRVVLLAAACLGLAAGIFAQGVDPAYSPAAAEDALLDHGYFVPVENGKLLALFIYNNFTTRALVRINTDGSIDSTFNCAGCSFSVTTMALQPDGKYVIAGGNSTASGAKLIRVNTDGTTDATLTNPFTGVAGAFEARVFAVGPDGKIYASVSAGSSQTLYRLNSDGSIDNAFASIVFNLGPTPPINQISVLADGKILVLGKHQSYGMLFRINTDGTKDTDWNSPALTNPGDPFNGPIITAAVPQPDGKVVIGGQFQTVNGLSRAYIARLNPDSGVDSAVVSGLPWGSPQFPTLLKQSDGKLILHSTFFMDSHSFRRLNGSDLSIDSSYVSPFASPDGMTINSLDQVTYVSSDELKRLNTDGSPDLSFHFGLPIPSSVIAVALQSDGKSIVAGNFKYINGTVQPSIARINTNGTRDASFVTGTGFLRFANVSPPTKLAVQPDGKVVAFGDNFDSYNGVARSRLVRLNTDGSLDAPFAPTVSGVNTIEVQADGKILLFGGNIAVNGFARTGAARLNSDGTLDSAFNPLIGSPSVSSGLVQTDGKIMIAGSFNGVNGGTQKNIARLNTDGTLDGTFNAGNISTIKKFAVQPSGRYVVATNTTSVVLRLNADGSSDGTFSPPVISGSGVTAIVAEADGSVVIAGSFTTPRPNILRLGPTGALDAAFLPAGANAQLRGLAPQADGKIIAVGDFTTIDGVSRSNIARIISSAATAKTPFDFDGDGRADYSVTRPGDFNWYQLTGVNYNFGAMQFGQTGDKVTPADFDGDGKTDVGVFRPSTGDWWYRGSSDSLQHGVHWGQNGDVPLAGDYNGDGKDDLVAVRNYGWWIANASNAQTIMFISFGTAGDKLLVGDFDGDGKADPAVYRPSEGNWYYAASGSGYPTLAFHWGIAEDIPAPADYDGDGKTDAAVFRPSEGNWYVLNSSNGTWIGLHFGLTGDKPIAADYDGDGKADIAVYRPSDHYWYVLGTTAGFYGFPFGLDTDIPSPNAFVP